MKTAKINALIVLPVAAMLLSTASAQPLTVPDVPRDKVICFALYTVQNNVLKLTAQLYPLEPGEDRTVRLETRQDGQWRQIAQTQVIEQGWTAPFRVERWDSTKDTEYRVAHGKDAYFAGTIRRDPVEKNVIVVAAFTGNSINPQHGGDIPRSDIVENIKKLKPDLLFFSGDQVYDHNRHYAAWLKFGRDFGEIIRNIPTVTIPDDHDVGQGNLWGQGGRLSQIRAGHDGGYAAPLEYVKEVERAQTSHLPDPFDPTPVERGIGVYYTNLTVGRISFAVIEDRKFKTGPEAVLPEMDCRPNRPDHVSVPDYDPRILDVPEATLLGERQLKFLGHWAADWRDCDMKAVLSQTVFCGGAHLHGSRNNRLYADLDSNGWPRPAQQRPHRDARLRPAHRRRPAPGHDHPSRRQRLERLVLLVLRPFHRQSVSSLVGAAGARQESRGGNAGLSGGIQGRPGQQYHHARRGQSQPRGEPRQADHAGRRLRHREIQ
jgi:hypothetical protein